MRVRLVESGLGQWTGLRYDSGCRRETIVSILLSIIFGLRALASSGSAGGQFLWWH